MAWMKDFCERVFKRSVKHPLGEETERKSVREQLKKKQPEQNAPQPKKQKRDEWER